MISKVQRFKAGGVVLGLGVVLAGCATTGGPPRQLAAQPQGAVGYEVCSGGHASRFPEREEVGRVCRTSVSLNGVVF